jgi:hypothetical protein
MHEDVWGTGYIDPRFLDLDASSRLVVRLSPQPLSPPNIIRVTHFLRGWPGLRAGEVNIIVITGTRIPTILLSSL